MSVAVSIVIPTRDRRRWLAGAIDSVLRQEHPDLEVFVVDDGSADGTAELLTSYAAREPAERFRFISQPNQGQARALNRGYRLARGELVGYLSDDDLLYPRAVSELAAALAANPSAVAAYPGYHLIGERGEIEDTIIPIEYSPAEALRLHDTIIGPGGLVRRSALDRADGWDPELRWMGDLIFWMGIGLEGEVVRVPRPLAAWRRHPGAATVRIGVDRAREHVGLVDRGLALEGLGEQPPAMRAEALRNACVLAAQLAGGAESWPGERFATIDLHWPLISARAAGREADARVDETGAQAAALKRAVAERTVEIVIMRGRLARGIPQPAPASGGGVESARERLLAAGALGGAQAASLGERNVRVALLEAAIACSADTDPGPGRFLVIDWQAAGGGAEPPPGVPGMPGPTAPVSQLRQVLARREQVLDGLRSRLSSRSAPR